METGSILRSASRATSRRTVLIAVAILAVVALRFAIVVTWHKTGGDGMQYFSLATQLRQHHTFGFAPNAPSYARLPGYPLFLAFVVAPMKSVSLAQHVTAAVIANVLLDVVSAAFIYWTLRRLRLRFALAAAVAFLALPTMWLMSCYAMTETLSTTIVAVELYLAVRILDAPSVGVAVVAGVVCAFGQLIRLDGACSFAMIACACLLAKVAWRRRLQTLAVFAVTSFVVFAPWPVRNLSRFGKMHLAASSSRTIDGRPFGDGLYQWARTWSDSAVGDSFFELYFVYNAPYQIDRPGAVPVKSYDDDAERKELIAVLQMFSRQGVGEKVDAAFHRLASDRLRRHWFRTLVVLPSKRLVHLVAPEPDYDMPMTVRWLGIPTVRPLFGIVDYALLVCALAGAVLLARSHRRLVWVLVIPVALRFGIYAFAVPHATTHRFLVEAFPILVVLAAALFSAWPARASRDGAA